MFDKRLIRKNLIIIFCVIALLLAIIFIRRTYSRYESIAESDVESLIAFWVINDSIQSKGLYIGEVVSGEYKEKTFTVSNYNETLSSKVPIDYSIIIDASTNMPLKYDLYKIIDGSKILCDKVESIYQDEDGTYYKRIQVDGFSLRYVLDEEDKTDQQFMLRATFPTYEEDGINDGKTNDENWEFADLVEHVRITINARQRVPEDDIVPEEPENPDGSGDDTNTEIIENIIVE